MRTVTGRPTARQTWEKFETFDGHMMRERAAACTANATVRHPATSGTFLCRANAQDHARNRFREHEHEHAKILTPRTFRAASSSFFCSLSSVFLGGMAATHRVPHVHTSRTKQAQTLPSAAARSLALSRLWQTGGQIVTVSLKKKEFFFTLAS